MTGVCWRVRRHLRRLDHEEGGLADRDALHLARCPSCSGFVRGYLRFGRELRREADAAVAELGTPNWERILAQAETASPLPAVGGAPFPAALRSRLGRGRAAVAKAALIAAVLCLGALLGYREYRFAAARSFVRSSTTEFVSGIFASSIFEASSAPTSLTGAIEVDTAWFDATDAPPPPTVGDAPAAVGQTR